MVFSLLILPVTAIVHARGRGEVMEIPHSLNPKFLNPFACAAGLVSGTVVTIVWNRVGDLKSIIYDLVPAFSYPLFSQYS